jgi:ABC-2 type transport system ATP-binding protein
MTTDLMIEAHDLTRRFDTVTAVDRLELVVRAGEIFGLVGPDGAGKTTTMRLLVGALSPDAGSITIDGQDMVRAPQRARRRLGYVAQRFSLYGDLTVAENLAFTADLFGVTRRAAAERATSLLELTDLTGARDRQAQFLSGGMKQKLALACALIHDPALLLLDEPTNGVDPIARREFWHLLTGLLARGVTILVSTAYLDEAELCGRVGFMTGGRMLVTGTPAELRGLVREVCLELHAQPRVVALRVARALPGVVEVRVLGDRLQVVFPPETPPEQARAALMAGLTAAGVSVTGVRQAVPSLEDAVIQLTRQAIAAGEMAS